MSTTTAIDECYRCGYDLRGIADDQPCPECGLLALRSRRETDELHHTRPLWLSRLSWGIWYILMAVGLGISWRLVAARTSYAVGSFMVSRGLSWWWLDVVDEVYHVVGLIAGAFFFMIGSWLMTTPEDIPEADRADRSRRWAIRLMALLPFATILAQLQSIEWVVRNSTYLLVACLVLSAALPLLLFCQLRGLARRARSAHLAEHCTIVGIGASCALLFTCVAFVIVTFADEIGLDRNWASRSTSWLVLMLIAGTATALFILWSLYLMIRFAIAFGSASRKLRKTWVRDDRSIPGEAA